MDSHCECSEPPLSEQQQQQPSGKINKAAFKLFGKRKSGSAIPSIFGVKSKGEGKSSGQTRLARSKTHDGLAEVVLEGSKKEDCSSSEQLNAALFAKTDGSLAVTASGSVTKSLSFFSVLKKNGRGENSEPRASNRQKKGLKGLFSSMRWHKKEKNFKEEKGGEASDAQPGVIQPASLNASLEFIKEEVRQLPQSEPELSTEQAAQELPVVGSSEEPKASVLEEPEAAAAAADCASPLPELYNHVNKQEEAAAEHNEGQSQGEMGVTKEEGPGDTMAAEISGATQPPEPECSGSSSPESAPLSSGIPTTTVTPPEPSAADPPSEQSIDRICSMFADVTSLKSFDSLTGCGDIIADHEEEVGNGNRNGNGNGNGNAGGSVEKHPPALGKMRVFPKKNQSGSVVAYQGGGEEMASPDEVDETDLQGFWDMLPQTEELQSQPKEEAVQETSTKAVEEKVLKETAPLGKILGLSKIPVSGTSRGVRSNKGGEESREKDHQESVPNSDEGYWDSTTPGQEEESGSSGFAPKESIPRDSCSGDALYDLYVDPDESLAGVVSSDEEMSPMSTSEPKLAPSSSSSSETTFRSLKGSASLPRDSKIPISVKQIPSHSASHGALVPSLTPTAQQPPAKPEPPRTKIPVPRVIVRRTGNKTLGGSAGKHLAYQDHFKK
ncbi:APC membrane recruitment protein 2-like [Huso huso]|uniref:APC membrane recruitment protein 2 n=1 Tax=Huso huso TaxID=61971 RepID=A0ABR0ZN07_HUSHU